MIRSIRTSLILALALAGCSHQVKPITAPAINIAASYDEKLPGKYAVLIEVDELLTSVKPVDINCAAHNYPLDLRKSLIHSVAQTLNNTLESGEVVETSLSREQLAKNSYAGLIVVRAHDLQPRLKFVPGYYQVTAEAQIEFLVSVTVNGQQGRLFGKTIEGDGREQTAGGAFCSGGSQALSQAAKKAIKRAMRGLAEAISNSPRLRAASAGQT